MNGIEIKQISKHFKETQALDSVSLTLEPQKIYGLLGRNGAGKSTLLNILTGRILPDQGTVLIDGMPAWENDAALSRLYLMSEKDCYPEGMRISEVFRWTKEFYPNFDPEKAGEMAEQFHLSLNKKTKALSTGYRSVFKLITALCANTPYVLLDEPVLGLDANHRELFYRLLLENYSENPRTFVLSTHLIEEVAALIEDVIIINNGRILRNETCEKLLAQGYTISGMAAAVDRYCEGRELIGTDTLGGLKTAYILGRPEKPLPDGLECSRLDLQKLFVRLTND
jgi:ABC-2 type transport system ATP-binding protein